MLEYKNAVVIGNFLCYPPFFPIRKIIRKNLLGLNYLRVMFSNLRYAGAGITRLKGEYLWLTDDWSNNYFHWHFDVLTRLIACRNNSARRKILLPGKLGQLKYVTETISFFGYEPVFLKNNRVYIVQSTESLPSLNYYDKEAITRLQRLVMGQLGKQGIKKKRFYIGRANAGRRRILNEELLEVFLRKREFEIVHPEDYSWSEQVRMFREAEIIAGIHGAGLTNAIYAPGLKLLIELRPAWQVNNLYRLLAETLSIPYAQVHLHADHRDMHGEGFTVTAGSILEMEGFMHNFE